MIFVFLLDEKILFHFFLYTKKFLFSDFRNMLHKDSEEARRQLMAQSGEDDGMYCKIIYF